MGGVADLLTSFGLIYLLGAGYTLFQLARNWRAFWDDELTPGDRQIAAGTAFFLLVPVGVLLHEFGHIAAAWSTGSRVLGLHFFGFWGYVEYIPSSSSALLEWYVSLSGNFISYVLGIICLAAGLVARVRPSLRVVLVQLGVLQLVQTLIFYPLISLDPEFAGDWDSIYSFAAPAASTVTALVHAVSLVLFVSFLKRNRTANWLLTG